MIERFRAARRDPELAVLEGLHALKHALRFHAPVLEAYTPDPDRLLRLAQRVAPDVVPAVDRLVRPVDPETFARLAPTPHPTGVIALARRAAFHVEDVLGARAGEAVPEPAGSGQASHARAGLRPVVLLDRPTHHGNVGAVVRVAAAAEAAAVLTIGPHDPWHPAALRGSAGLHYALPVLRLPALPATNRTIVVLDPEGEPLDAWTTGIPGGAVLVFGSERSGVSESLRERADRRVRIPMREGVSSLNLATAVAVALYAGPAPPPRHPPTPPHPRTGFRVTG